MRRTFRFRQRQKVEPPKYRLNQFITVPEVRLIDNEGANVGVVTLAKALAMAQERGMDVIEVSPKAVPPVCRLDHYGSFKYREEKEKQKQKAKQKKIEIKGMRISLNIGDHDRDVRLEQAKEFFTEGHKVRIEMILRGRERQHVDLARKAITDFIGLLGEGIEVEQPISVMGGRFSTIVYKKI
ncbi:MAG: translation initiation factor IF-3 [bacterium]|nr:translation initiation factor IF-3 [bacterium]